MNNKKFIIFSVIVLLTFVVITFSLFSQNKPASDLEKLMIYFNNPDSIINYKKLPYKIISSEGEVLKTLIDIQLLENIMNTKFSNQVIGIFPGKILFENELIGLTLISHCGAGAFCEFQHLLIFDSEGNFKTEHKFGKRLSGGGETLHKENVFCSDSLMIFKTTDFTNFGEKIKSIELETISISKTGEVSIKNKERVNLKRKNYWVSTEVIQDSTFSKLSKEQLSIIRNEIYASKGYIFKSNIWREYFDNTKWYEAKFKSVEEKLSEIEKLNISKIMKYEQ